MTRSTAVKIVALLIIVTSAVALAFVFPVAEWLNRFLTWVRSLGVWGPVLLVAVYVPATVLLVPGSWLTLGAGFAFGTIVGAASASLGSVLGASAAFLLGRTVARRPLERRIAGRRRFRALDRGVADEGFKIVLLTRLSPVLPYNLLSYTFGITRVRFRDYVIASWLGMLPGSLMYSYLGWVTQNVTGMATGEMDREAAQWAILIVGLIATIAVTVVITRIARRALREEVPEVEAE